jgi:hypothetical protein
MPFDQIVESSDPVLVPVPLEDVGLEPIPDITNWPWPKLVPTAYHTFIFLEGAESILFLYELMLNDTGLWEGTNIGAIGAIADIDTVEVVDFGLYYVVCVTGTTTRNFARLEGNELLELSQPLFATGCNNNGQLVGGNISHWQDLGSDGIIWSGIGSYEFNPGVEFTAGYKTLVNGILPGKRVTVKKILPFGGGCIVYTDFGSLFLSDRLIGNTFVYGANELEGIGVASGNHVAGNSFTQAFVNLNNELCKFQLGGTTRAVKEMKILGFKRQIEELKEPGTPLLLSFLEDRNTFFLSNGVSTLVVNDFGAGMIHQAISGVVKGWNELLYATFRDMGDKEARVTLDSNAMDSRGKKTLEWIIADISCAATTHVSASAYWRNGVSEEYRTYYWKNGSPSGEFFIGLSAVEYRVAMRFSNYLESEIFGLKLNMKYPDSRTRRGIAAISGRTQSADTQAST